MLDTFKFFRWWGASYWLGVFPVEWWAALDVAALRVQGRAHSTEKHKTWRPGLGDREIEGMVTWSKWMEVLQVILLMVQRSGESPVDR